MCRVCFGSGLKGARSGPPRGPTRQAVALLETFTPPVLLVEEVLFKLEAGRIYERLGQRDQAIAKYRFVVAAWRNADPELQPYVEEAKTALRRLSAERP